MLLIVALALFCKLTLELSQDWLWRYGNYIWVFLFNITALSALVCRDALFIYLKRWLFIILDGLWNGEVRFTSLREHVLIGTHPSLLPFQDIQIFFILSFLKRHKILHFMETLKDVWVLLNWHLQFRDLLFVHSLLKIEGRILYRVLFSPTCCFIPSIFMTRLWTKIFLSFYFICGWLLI